MILTCTKFTSEVRPDGRIQLTLDDGKQDPGEDRLLIHEIASLLKTSPSTIYQLSRRKHDPLPLIRGKGRPYSFRSSLDAWLKDRTAEEIKARAISRAMRVFGD